MKMGAMYPVVVARHMPQVKVAVLVCLFVLVHDDRTFGKVFRIPRAVDHQRLAQRPQDVPGEGGTEFGGDVLTGVRFKGDSNLTVDRLDNLEAPHVTLSFMISPTFSRATSNSPSSMAFIAS